jgi:acylphosphatase
MIDLRFTAVVRGRVQGVGFRWSTQRIARGLGLVGTVRNLRDGAVEVIAEGPRVELAGLREWLATGPPGAHVTELTVTDQPTRGGFNTFDIV